jgi:nitrite reductase/ring-hydroxylating ferredoxin subunit/uncharacterized membrane protein
MSGLLGKLSASSPWLDPIADKLKQVTSPLLGENGPQAVKDLLYGTWVGHPLHPFMTDITLGSLTTSMALDVLGEERGADMALKLGVLSSGVTALSGAAQWYDATNNEEPRRLGALHAELNSIALGFYIASWVLRERDNRTAGIATAWIGHGLAHASAYIGGHLTYNLGIGVDRTINIDTIEEWSDTGIQESALTHGEVKRVEVGDVPVMILKDHTAIYAASPVCTHLTGPLDEGPVDGSCVECPWHGSVFDLTNGNVVHGPATAALPIYETRVVTGQIQVRTRPDSKG